MKTLLVFCLTLGFSLFAKATLVAASQEELSRNCYAGSPMLMSDMCWGQVFSPSTPSSNNLMNLQSIAAFLKLPGQESQARQIYNPMLNYPTSWDGNLWMVSNWGMPLNYYDLSNQNMIQQQPVFQNVK